MSFDIVIPVGPLDYEVFSKQVEYTKKNIVGYRNIYVVSSKEYSIPGCIFVNENIFPFTLQSVHDTLGESSRNGWYLQQLIKLYAGFIIPDIIETYLVIDSDTFFLKPTTFIEDGKCLYNIDTHHHTPYFQHMKKLHPDLVRYDPHMSGICHHMIFEVKYIRELFCLVGGEFWKKFLENVDDDKLNSGASEYEIYFNFMMRFHPSNICIRPLTWCNVRNIDENINMDYISYHWYMR
uniref:Nucleotide-diphospho-sugar transferase domain-containing protein n=1 Tax=viral metagenome TaxID=1070528 RepID=A0A6C0AI08_9ZZZZ